MSIEPQYTPAYVVWYGDDGPSLHGPFETTDDALTWARDDWLSFQGEDEYNNAQAWYDESPKVWIVPLLPV